MLVTKKNEKKRSTKLDVLLDTSSRYDKRHIISVLSLIHRMTLADIDNYTVKDIPNMFL